MTDQDLRKLLRKVAHDPRNNLIRRYWRRKCPRKEASDDDNLLLRPLASSNEVDQESFDELAMMTEVLDPTRRNP